MPISFCWSCLMCRSILHLNCVLQNTAEAIHFEQIGSCCRGRCFQRLLFVLSFIFLFSQRISLLSANLYGYISIRLHCKHFYWKPHLRLCFCYNITPKKYYDHFLSSIWLIFVVKGAIKLHISLFGVDVEKQNEITMREHSASTTCYQNEKFNTSIMVQCFYGLFGLSYEHRRSGHK